MEGAWHGAFGIFRLVSSAERRVVGKSIFGRWWVAKSCHCRIRGISSLLLLGSSAFIMDILVARHCFLLTLITCALFPDACRRDPVIYSRSMLTMSSFLITPVTLLHQSLTCVNRPAHYAGRVPAFQVMSVVSRSQKPEKRVVRYSS